MNTQSVSVHLLSKKEQDRLIKAGVIEPLFDPMAQTKERWFEMCRYSQHVSTGRMAILCGVSRPTFLTYLGKADTRKRLIDKFWTATQPSQRDVTLIYNTFRNVARKGEVTNE
jgi:dihydropteroate synthase